MSAFRTQPQRLHLCHSLDTVFLEGALCCLICKEAFQKDEGIHKQQLVIKALQLIYKASVPNDD